jgi:hypothetical protein
MKTFLILFALTSMSIMTHAHDNKFGYVIISQDTLYCQRMNVNHLWLKCTLQSGEKMKIPLTEVKMYSDGDHLNEKMPVYIDNKETGKMALMELISYQNGIKIYKYEHYNTSYECWEVILSYYVKGACVCTQTNPSIEQVDDFLKCQKKDNELKLFNKELSER